MSQAPDTPPAERQQARPPTVDDALTLARYGLPIIPLSPRTKHPPKGFTDWKPRASLDPATIRHWWQKWPGANVGSVIPRGVLVIDVDPRHGGAVGWKNLLARHGDVPATSRVWTGRQDGGFHLYFTRAEEVEIPEATDLDQGVQILGPGHLVVLPPSLHPDTGKAYQWDEAHNPCTMPTPAPVPWWLLRLTLDAQKKKLGDTRAMREASTRQPTAAAAGGGGERVESESDKPSQERCKAAEELGVPPPRPTPGSSGVHPPSKGYGDRAAATHRVPASMPTLRKVLDYPEDLQDGMSVHCPCPEHTHGDRSASGVWREPKGNTLDYGVWCFKAKKRYTLTELFHFQEGSSLLQLRAEVEADGTRHEHRRAFLMWGLRLLERARLMMIPKEWGYPMLPRSAPADCQTLWPVILDVKRFRNATEQGSKPLPLSYDFLRDWSTAVRHWGHKRMQAAFTWLVSHAFLRKAGEYWQGCKKTLLWCVGGLRGRHARKDAPVERTIDKAVESVEATPVPEPVAHTGHAWSAMAPPTTRVCPLAADDPDHDESTCVLWQVWLRSQAKGRLFGRSTVVELPNRLEPVYDDS